ncbi:MAG: hypothetical protein ACI4B5_03385, partial [Bacteroidaceae bacterium]
FSPCTNENGLSCHALRTEDARAPNGRRMYSERKTRVLRTEHDAMPKGAQAETTDFHKRYEPA